MFVESKLKRVEETRIASLNPPSFLHTRRSYAEAEAQTYLLYTTPMMSVGPSQAASAEGSSEAEARAANRARFEIELEFVQALANPFYLHSLAQQNVLSQPVFVNFLQYLLYWKEKDYARLLQ